MADRFARSPYWILVQFGFGAAAFGNGLLALAMTFPTPPLFDLQLIYAVLPGLLLFARILGAIALLLVPLTIRAPGRGQWLMAVSTILGTVGFGLGVYLSALIAGAA